MNKRGFFLVLILAVVFLMNVAEATMKYEIIYETAKIRTDGGKNYFVLIKPVNLKNDKFKKDIEEAVRAIAKEKGRQITIDFFSDRKLLEDVYQNQLKSIARFEKKAEVQRHVARFIDQSGYGDWIFFFPMSHPSNLDSNTFGKYYEYYIFDPYPVTQGAQK